MSFLRYDAETALAVAGFHVLDATEVGLLLAYLDGPRTESERERLPACVCAAVEDYRDLRAAIVAHRKPYRRPPRLPRSLVASLRAALVADLVAGRRAPNWELRAAVVAGSERRPVSDVVEELRGAALARIEGRER